MGPLTVTNQTVECAPMGGGFSIPPNRDFQSTDRMTPGEDKAAFASSQEISVCFLSSKVSVSVRPGHLTREKTSALTRR